MVFHFCSQYYLHASTSLHPTKFNASNSASGLDLKSQGYLPVRMPLNLGAVDEELEKWVEPVKPDLLCLTALVPENDRISSEHGVPILVKLNALV